MTATWPVKTSSGSYWVGSKKGVVTRLCSSPQEVAYFADNPDQGNTSKDVTPPDIRAKGAKIFDTNDGVCVIQDSRGKIFEFGFTSLKAATQTLKAHFAKSVDSDFKF